MIVAADGGGQFLAECLDSIVKQTFSHLEVVVVHDRSDEGLAAIVREYAGRDRRIRVIAHPGGGRGGARNEGVRQARGRYFAFVAPEDTLPAKALAAHMAALRRTGSDFTAGAARQPKGGKLVATRWMKETNAADDLKATIARRPDMMAHTAVSTKVFRADFWRSNALAFSEGVRGEDQLACVHAFVKAAAFDVLSAVVCVARFGDRGAATPIDDISHVEDAIKVSGAVNAVLADHPAPALRRVWLDERILNHSMRLFTDDIDYAEPGYYALVVTWLDGIFTDSDWAEPSEAPILKRLLAWFLVHGTREQVAEIRMRERTGGGYVPTVITSGSVYADLALSALRERSVPEQLLRLGESATAAAGSIQRLTWDGPHRLTLTGWAYIGGIDLGVNETAITILGTNDSTGEVLEFAASMRADLEVSRRNANRYADVDRSGFDAHIDLAAIYERAGSRAGQDVVDAWRLTARIVTGGIVREARLARPRAAGGARTPFPGPAVGDLRVQPEWDKQGLRLTVRRSGAPSEQPSSGGQRARTPNVHVHHVGLAAQALTIKGTSTGFELRDLVLESRRNRLVAQQIEVSSTGEFSARFVLELAEWGGSMLPIPVGEYRLKGVDAELVEIDSYLDDAIFARMPMDSLGLLGSGVEPSTYRLRSTAQRSLVLDAVDQLGAYESRAAQTQLQERVYRPRVASASTEHAVLFESNRGRHITCNPAAIWSELAARETDLAAYWTVNDLSVAVPPGTTPLVRLSRQWYELLASAKYLVSNNHFPHFFTKSPAQVHVQTWHGTPLKCIGHDALRNVFSNRAYLATADREVLGWDHLITPNSFCSEVMPGAFNYHGDLIESGYPRNDVLTNDPQGAAERARRILNLEADQRVLLYAPTWRDDQNTGKSLEFASVTFLDTEQFVEAFGGEYTILVRGHNNTMLYGDSASGKSVIDVTRYPEIADLYAVADVMITDYSSVMFDYAVTGKPMVFLVPDLADYRDRVRGFYFDFTAQAPGPLAMSTQEVIDVMADLDRTNSEYADRYAKFQDRFTNWEDGGASARVVDRVFGDRGDA